MPSILNMNRQNGSLVSYLVTNFIVPIEQLYLQHNHFGTSPKTQTTVSDSNRKESGGKEAMWLILKNVLC